MKKVFLGLCTIVLLLLSSTTALASDSNKGYIEPCTFKTDRVTYQYTAGVTTSDYQACQTAFKVWQNKLDNKIKFVKVSHNKNAMVKIYSKNCGTMTNNSCQLAVTWIYYNQNLIRHNINSCKINFFDTTMAGLSMDTIQWKVIIAEHEVGHLLGLGELDTTNADVMARYFNNQQPVYKITSKDIHTIQKLYRMKVNN